MPKTEFSLAATDAGLEPRLLRAIAEIREYSGTHVSVADKAKSLIKFGRCGQIDNSGFKTIWEGQAINDEPPLFGDPSLGNVVDTISSADTNDNQIIRIEGHTKSGNDLTFVTQLATLDGFNEVQLSTPLHVVTRIVNASATEFTGPIYIYDNTDGSSSGVPTDPSDVAGYVRGSAANAGQQSHFAGTAISSTDTWLLTQLTISSTRQQSASYDIHFQKRKTTGVWLPIELELDLNTNGTTSFSLALDPCLIVPNNSYVRAEAISSSATDGEVQVSMAGYLASIVT